MEGGAIGVDREREERMTHEGVGVVVWISVSLSSVWYGYSLLFCFFNDGLLYVYI
jgi:hypothetical protein